MENIIRLQNEEAFKILGEPTRLEILQRLISYPATITQLGQELKHHPAQIRYHISRLENIGLVELGFTKTIKNYTEKYYQATTKAVFLNRAIFSWPSTKGQVVILGGDGPALDLLISETNKKIGENVFCAIPMGSLDSLIYLREQYCHIAGCHLYDLGSGDFNFSYIRHLFTLKNMVVVTFGNRDQGFLFKKARSGEINNIEDIVEKKLRFVNRKIGSATRMRFDQILDEHNIPAEKINGYDHDVQTHNEVGDQIQQGKADVGLGLSSVARQKGLDFSYLFTERYDLVMTRDMFESPHIQLLVGLMQDKDLKKKMEGFGGYDLINAGNVVYI